MSYYDKEAAAVAVDADVEKQHGINGRDSPSSTAHILERTEATQLKRSLKQRHIQMVALAGAIGTGLFLSLGDALQTGGPLGALLGYGLIGIVVCCVQFGLGEVSAMFPVTGSFVRHAETLVDPALGFAIGWNVVYGAFLSVPSEISAALVLIQYWTDELPALWISLFIIVTFLVGIAFVGVYGEVEFVMAILKILLIVGIIIMGLVIDLGGVPGQDRIGFAYWKNPGPFVQYLDIPGSLGRFLGFWAVMNNAVYSFAGVESLSVAAAETQNPRQNIPKACRRVFARVTIFYILGVLIAGMLVPSNDPNVENWAGNASESPFVLAASRAGIKVVPSILNAVVLTSAWSAGNQSMLAGTRFLYGLALKGQAPKVFLKTTKWGIPWVCVALQTAIALLSYMSLSSGALNVFYWFLDLTSSAVLFSWGTISFCHIRMLQAFKKQGIPTSEMPWHSAWTWYGSWFSFIACIIFFLTGGFTVFINGQWDVASFISSYLDLPIVFVLYFGWKFFKRTKIIPLEEVPLRQALDEIRENPEEPIPEPTGWHRFNILWE